MKKSGMIIILVAISALILTACSSTSAASTPPGPMSGTPMSGTPMSAPLGMTETTATVAATAEPTETSAPTSTPAPTLTPTPVTVDLTVISAIGCVNKPSESAAFAGVMDTGAVLQALGRNEANNFYYIENPSVAGGHCWIWNNYVLINGISSDLPVVESN